LTLNARATNPLSAAISLNRMMWRNFDKLNDALNHVVNSRPIFNVQTQPAGQILPFQKKGQR
jgi:hypothetical protein